MKKYLIVLAAALFTLVSCEKDSNKYTSLSFKEKEVTVALGATGKLQVLYEPTTLDAPVCEWSSSKPEIVSVDENGNIEALAIGEAVITAKNGKLEAACKIIVMDPLDMVAWGGFTCVDHGTEPLSKDTLDYVLNDGTPVKCVMVNALYYIWDDGVMYVDGVGLTGAGYLVEAQGTTWCITDSIDENGANYYYLGNRKYTLTFKNIDSFDWSDTTNVYCAVTGKLGDAAKHYEWLMSETSTLDDMTEIKGSYVNAVNFETGKYMGLFLGLPAEGTFLGDRTVAYYKANFNWFDYENTAYGLLFEQHEDGEWYPKEPAQWGQLIPKYYEYLPEEGVASYHNTEAMAPAKIQLPAKNKKDVLIKL